MKYYIQYSEEIWDNNTRIGESHFSKIEDSLDYYNGKVQEFKEIADNRISGLAEYELSQEEIEGGWASVLRCEGASGAGIIRGILWKDITDDYYYRIDD